ncbi:hypothetical protein AAFF_G00309990 [Aldrovandia affinis]|uniref:Uncharacterized protein n=1 Tax=Aldrovandia affinis TaxID=143900 RepID=A0AAD7SP41_9TELE|nr:hypothetical protein AAFF_G00309990 [Aldrovandia affinis]
MEERMVDTGSRRSPGHGGEFPPSLPSSFAAPETTARTASLICFKTKGSEAAEARSCDCGGYAGCGASGRPRQLEREM